LKKRNKKTNSISNLPLTNRWHPPRFRLPICWHYWVLLKSDQYLGLRRIWIRVCTLHPRARKFYPPGIYILWLPSIIFTCNWCWALNNSQEAKLEKEKLKFLN
jgi:hypothetical protein